MNQDHSLTWNMTLPPEAMKAFADYLLDRMKPMVADMARKDDDTILDVKGLAAYLRVDENWIYQRTRKHEIPFIKKGKYCLFRKAVIDAWLNQDAVKPLSPFTPHKRRNRLSD
jgi:excisionase family DNA binding protein